MSISQITNYLVFRVTQFVMNASMHLLFERETSRFEEKVADNNSLCIIDFYGNIIKVFLCSFQFHLICSCRTYWDVVRIFTHDSGA